MTYWTELFYLPPDNSEIVIFLCTSLLFSLVKKNLKIQHAALVACLVFLIAVSALPHLTDKGMFSFHDFGETLFSTPLGLVLSRYIALLISIFALRQITKKYLPSRFFFKN